MPDFDLSPAFVRLARHFKQKIVSGQWAPGQLIPGEEALALELKVSVGTVRKALDALSGQGLISRHRGRGSFVSRATDERAFTSFFRLAHRADGERRLPVDKLISRITVAADKQEQQALGLAPGGMVYRVRRRRSLEGQPAVLEIISFRAADLKGESWDNMDETLALVYSFLEQRCGISIHSVTDRIRAAACPKSVANELGLPAGHPVLDITRIGRDLRGDPVELRRSWVCTDAHDYLSELRWASASGE